MANLQNTFGDPINSQGDLLVQANTGQACGDTLTNILSAGSIIFDSSAALHGWTLGCTVGGISGSTQFVGWNGQSDSQAAWLVSFTTEAAMPSVSIVRAQSRTAAGKSLSFVETTAGKPQLQDSGGTAVWTGATAMSRSTAYRFEVAQGTGSAATVKCDYYALGTTTPVATGFNSTSCNAGSGNLTETRFGLVTGTTYTGNARMGRIAYSGGATAYLGVYVPPPPWVSAGNDLVVAHGRTGSMSARVVPTPNTTATLAWAGSTGAPALASGATTVTPTTAAVTATPFAPGTAPVDTAYTYTLTATGSDNQVTSASMKLTAAHALLNRLDSGSGQFKPVNLVLL